MNTDFYFKNTDFFFLWPYCVQVEINPVWQQRNLREFCREKGIQLMAYSPLGAKGTHWGSDSVMDSGILHEIAKAKGKSVAQARYAHLVSLQMNITESCRKKWSLNESVAFLSWVQ